ncbi:class F sortase [Actinomadura kijaniata]|uniref:class F sortase n=1 Tax=Actinomadura kijaniata TaxID=46161 RepID=UPI001FE1DB2F|nr:class F sortase [Actinomadura kijaniata]
MASGATSGERRPRWRARRSRYALVAVAGVVGTAQMVFGCALIGSQRAAQPRSGLVLPTTPAAPLSGPQSAAPDAPRPLPGFPGRALPTSLSIPSIGVNSPLVRVGREGNGAIAAPPLERPGAAGWYGYGPTPGEPGAAVIVGHLDTRTGPAVFARLGELRPGALLGVARADGTVPVFRVTSAERVPKNGFPATRVHASADGRPALRLVTCAGRYDPRRHLYAENLVVYATFTASYRLADLVPS